MVYTVSVLSTCEAVNVKKGCFLLMHNCYVQFAVILLFSWKDPVKKYV